MAICFLCLFLVVIAATFATGAQKEGLGGLCNLKSLCTRPDLVLKYMNL